MLLFFVFDTHCHLNFKRFKDNVKEVIDRAKEAGIIGIIVPGTDLYTSKVSVELSNQYEGIYSAVGIHPHHALEYQKSKVKNQKYISKFKSDIDELKNLITHPKVVAVGEVGLDKHQYAVTKYQQYTIDEEFLRAQKQLLTKQIQLALEYDKSLILHNREAKEVLLPLLKKNWDEKLKGRTVFHCCEPDPELLEFARNYGIFIGVDGDVTYGGEKSEFIKTVPLEMLVTETDSPYLLPEPLRTKKQYPNEPKHISIILDCISKLKKQPKEKIREIVKNNAKMLFQLPEN